MLFKHLEIALFYTLKSFAYVKDYQDYANYCEEMHIDSLIDNL